MKISRKSLFFNVVILSVLILFPPLLLSQTRLTVAPEGEATTASDGVCCSNGQVISATQVQCRQKKGQYFSARAEALRHCKPNKVFCCVNGKVSEVSPEQCERSNGVAYSTAGEAKNKCRPEAVYCCLKGSVKKVSAGECKKKKGIAYKTERDARENCGWCCADNKVSPATPDACKRNGGNYFTNKSQADKECRKQPQCCIKGKLFTYSKRECDLKKGKYYRSYGEAQKQCRVERTQTSMKPLRPEQTSANPGRTARPMPDLIVSNINLIKDCKIEITIKNIGTSGVPASGYDLNTGAGIQMYNGAKAWGGIRLGAIDLLGRLKTPGNSVKYVWFPQAANLALGAGTHSIKVVVDSNNGVAELNENNNSKTSRLMCKQPVTEKEQRKMQNEVSKRTDGVPQHQTELDLKRPPSGTLKPLRGAPPPDQNQPQHSGVFGQLDDPSPVAQSAVRADIPDFSVSEGMLEPIPTEPADLSIAMSMSPQNAVIGVDTITVTIKVTNIGGRATSANTEVTLAFGDYPYVNHPLLNLDQWTIPRLGPGGEHTVTYQQIIPEHYIWPGGSVSYTVESGVYLFRAGIDTSTLASDETTNYSNDVAELIFQLTTPPRPDLVVCFSKFVSTRANGTQYVVYSPVVKNIGNAPSGSVNVRFYIEDKGVQNYAVPGLPAGGEYSGVNYQTVWYVRGDHDYTLWVDSNNDVVESNEVNNSIVGTIHVFGIFAADAQPTSPIQCSNEPGMAN